MPRCHKRPDLPWKLNRQTAPGVIPAPSGEVPDYERLCTRNIEGRQRMWEYVADVVEAGSARIKTTDQRTNERLRARAAEGWEYMNAAYSAPSLVLFFRRPRA